MWIEAIKNQITYTNNDQSEKTEQDRESQDDKPNNVNQKQSLGWERGRTAIPNLAEP